MRVPPPRWAVTPAPTATPMTAMSAVFLNCITFIMTVRPNVRRTHVRTYVGRRSIPLVAKFHRGFGCDHEWLDEFVRNAGTRHVHSNGQHARGARLQVDDVL